MTGGVHRLAGLASGAQCAQWLALAEAALAQAAFGDPPAWPCGLRLADLPPLFESVCTALHANVALDALLQAAIGPRRVLLVDHAFVRHQPAPALRRAGQHPHSWHQDGALAFDFIAAGSPPYRADALLPIQTCWLPLTPCGTEAPGLEWVEPALGALLAPSELGDDAMAQRLATLPLPSRHVTAMLDAGDGLLFGGGLLHRTHADPAMRWHRTSVELRWMAADAVPARLAAGRLQRVA